MRDGSALGSSVLAHVAADGTFGRTRLAGHSSGRKPAKAAYGPGGRLRLSWYSAATAAGIQPLSQR